MALAKALWTALRQPRYGLVDIVVAAIVLAAVLYAGMCGWVKARNRQLNAAVFQSPLPDVRVADEKIVADSEAYGQPYDFTVNWFTWNIPVWETILAPYQGKPDVRYLEIGAYEGRSSIWMLENILSHPTSRMTAIDPFDGPYKERFVANVTRSGATDRVTMITGYSQLKLRDLPLDSFHIIYIDGSHSKDDVLEDAVLCWRLLKNDGLMIFDDYRWAGCFVSGTCDRPTDFPKAAIDPFVQCFAEQCTVVHNSYQLILQKKVRTRQQMPAQQHSEGTSSSVARP